MGDMADLYDYWDDNPNDEDEILALIKAETWATAGGKEIKICKMETQHIKNCINYIKRQECGGMLDDYR